MLAAEQILHAAMILSVESDDGYDEGIIAKIQTELDCDDSDNDAAMAHIEKHRDEGRWGGRREAVLHRSAERLRQAQNDDRLPSGGPLADEISGLIGDDDGEVDPFAELGIGGGGGFSPAASVRINDPLAAFMDDDEEEEEMVVDESGFLAFPPQEATDDTPSEEPTMKEVEEEPPAGEEVEVEAESAAVDIDPEEAYRMLMSTCWIDGILDPAEAKLLARKREELNIPFTRHLELLREMLERAA